MADTERNMRKIDDTARTETGRTRMMRRADDATPPRTPRVKQNTPPAPYQKRRSSQRTTDVTPGRARPRSRTRRSSQHGPLWLPWWSIAAMMIIVVFVVMGMVVLFALLGGRRVPIEPTAIVMIVTDPAESAFGVRPTVAPAQNVPPTAIAPATVVLQTANPQPNAALIGPTLPAVAFTPTPLPIRVGGRIEVEGVNDNQLNVRSTSSVTNSQVLFRAAEDEQFTIIAGPVQADGFIWWQIRDPDDPNRIGWAVSNYLNPIE